MKALTGKTCAAILHGSKTARSERSGYQRIRRGIDDGQIQRVSKGLYVLPLGNVRKPYVCRPGESLRLIVKHLRRNCPRTIFQVWEMSRLDEFLAMPFPHQVRFIETPKESEAQVFAYLKAHYPNVLLNPTPDIFRLYRGNEETIVVLRLISEAPAPMDELGSCCLEKLLVDLFSRSISGKILGREQYKGLYEQAFKKYLIDEKKMFRYAARRNAAETIKKFLREETEVKLLTEQNR